jgi:hypothetical protein
VPGVDRPVGVGAADPGHRQSDRHGDERGEDKHDDRAERDAAAVQGRDRLSVDDLAAELEAGQERGRVRARPAAVEELAERGLEADRDDEARAVRVGQQ